MAIKVKVVLAGLNGYGKYFASLLMQAEPDDNYQLAGIISTNPQKSIYYKELCEKNIPVFSSLNDYFKSNKADLVIITTPMHIHKQQVLAALENGANVFCEKPLAPTIDDCFEIKKAAEKAGKFVAVGFQWSYSKPMQQFKADIMANRFGKPKLFKTIASWSRSIEYLSSVPWRTKNKAEDGRYILANVLSNNTLHYLHNMFFLLGDKMQSSDYPVSISGEGYIANDVEGYDTSCLRATTKSGCELLYLTTICAKEETLPAFTIEFENAVAGYNYPEEDEMITVLFNNGEQLIYQSPNKGRYDDIFICIDAIQNGTVPVCTVDTVLPQIICVNAAMDNIPAVKMDKSLIKLNNDKSCYFVEGIDEIMKECFIKNKLPSELNIPWAKYSKPVDISGYRHFEGKLV